MLSKILEGLPIVSEEAVRTDDKLEKIGVSRIQ